MGYETQYGLGIFCDMNSELLGDSRRSEILEFLKNNEEWELFRDSMREYPSKALWSASYEIKWYNHETDMADLSNIFPDVIFVLEGEGEEWDDKWKKYFLNGRVCRCPAEVVIVYPEFDANNLSTPKKKLNL